MTYFGCDNLVFNLEMKSFTNNTLRLLVVNHRTLYSVNLF